MQRRAFLLGATAAAAIAGGAGYLRARIVETPAQVRYPGMQAGHACASARCRATDARLRRGDPGLRRRRPVLRLETGARGPCRFRRGRGAGIRRQRRGALDGLDYPTGAHYLPLPSRESTHVREMLADFGLIERDAGGDTPYYDETALVHSPQERLLRDGRWEDSLLPMQGLPEADLAQHRRFLAQVQALHTRRGNDGRKVFAIPLTLSSRDPAWTALDGITFRQWLEREGYTSPALRWYLDYCCRDDYGADTSAVSAWAGLHYFAARDGHAANAAEGAVLTWPGGLSTLVARMRAAISARLGHERWLLPARPRASAKRPPARASHASPMTAAPTAGAPRRLRHAAIRGAAPAARHPRLWLRPGGAFAARAWMVSNFVMDGYPLEAPGEPLSWDNVVYQGQGLGYVVSTHQLLRVARSPRSVFTAYHALSRLEPADARRWLSQASPEALRDEAAADLIAAYGEEFWRARAGHHRARPCDGHAALRQPVQRRTGRAAGRRRPDPVRPRRPVGLFGVRGSGLVGRDGGGAHPGRAPRSRLKEKPAARLVQAGGGLDATASVF